jgi:hypothetical protein
MSLLLLGRSTDAALAAFRSYCLNEGTLECVFISDLSDYALAIDDHGNQWLRSRLATPEEDPSARLPISGAWFRDIPIERYLDHEEREYIQAETHASLCAFFANFDRPVLNRPRPTGNRVAAQGGPAIRKWVADQTSIATPQEFIGTRTWFQMHAPSCVYRRLTTLETGDQSLLETVAPDELLLGIAYPPKNRLLGIHVGPDTLWYYETSLQLQHVSIPNVPTICVKVLDCIRSQHEEFGVATFVLDPEPLFLGYEANPPAQLLIAVRDRLFPLIAQYLSWQPQF